MKPPIEPHRKYFSQLERTQWVMRFRSSGLSQAQFAEQNGLKLKTLQKWVYGRSSRRAGRQQPTSGVRRPVHRDQQRVVPKPEKLWRVPSPTFQEVRLPPLGALSADWAAEVAWPSGVTVRLGVRTEAAWIGALLKAVRQAC